MLNKAIEDHQTSNKNIMKGQYLFPKLDNSKQKDKKLKYSRIDLDFERLKNDDLFAKDLFKNNQYNIKDQKIKLSEHDEWYNKGFKDGFEEGVSTEKKNIKQIIKHLEKTLEELNDIKVKTVKEFENQITKLSIAIANKIIEREVRIDKEIIKNIVVNILKGVDEPENIKIRINPIDLEKFYESDLNLAEFKGIKFINDNSISKGGCLVETENGDIDARIEKRLEMIEEAFKNINQ